MTLNYDILSPEKDPMGTAILDYQKTGKAGKLRVLSSMFEEDEMGSPDKPGGLSI